MNKLLVVLSTIALATACHRSEAQPPPAPAPSSAPTAANRFEVHITEKGFEPDHLRIPAGKPVSLVFERKTDETCAKQVVVTLGDGKTIQKDLPLGQPVEIAATVPKPATLDWVCGMGMMKGTILVQ